VSINPAVSSSLRGAKPGDDFVQVIDDQVAAADVLLVVIGHRWGELLAARADDPDDFVVLEIKAALEHNKRAIPVLVGGAVMPRADMPLQFDLEQVLRDLPGLIGMKV
jgi:hypothetical protein